jgi:hypothetical protein
MISHGVTYKVNDCVAVCAVLPLAVALLNATYFSFQVMVMVQVTGAFDVAAVLLQAQLAE